LMKHYLEFFGLNIDGPYPYFHAGAATLCQGKTTGFTDDSFDQITSRSWEFPGGFPSSSALADPEVRYDSIGQFDVKLTVSDGVRTKSILKKNYITVDRCNGLAVHPAGPVFRIYPNPATSKVNIEAIGETSGECRCILLDFTGRRVVGQKIFPVSAGSTVSMDLAGLKSGLYFLKIQCGTYFHTGKLVIL
ncbi:MAG: T9SS type A sorting domain-containing protein, partial [Bacteroidota bacterium]